MSRTFTGLKNREGNLVGHTVSVEPGDGEVTVTFRDDGSDQVRVDRRASDNPARDADKAGRFWLRSGYSER